MQPSEPATRTLVLHSREITAEPDSPVRVVPVWASPPDLCSLVMLGQSPPDGTAANAAAAAALRVIRHRLERRRGEGMWTFGVTSARDGEGKTTLATQLALVLGESRRARVLLIEASMLRPAIARVLGFRVPAGTGFSAQLAQRMRGGADPWTVLALGPALHALVESEADVGFPETLHSTHFRRALEHLGRTYDWVVVDAPSVLGSGDANVVEDAVDGMIVVARSRMSRGSELRAAMTQLGDRKALGVVLWDVADGGAKR
jgi:Mrp family chromosome partitioning ATPase